MLSGKRFWIGLLAAAFAAPMLIGAARRVQHADWPSANVVAKAAANVKYQSDHTATAKFRGHEVKFVPSDISDISDAGREKGMIIGKLTTTWPSADKLPTGSYQVFVRKYNDTWQAFFCQQDEPMAKSTEVKSDLDDDHKPSFDKDNTTIRYWRLRVAY